MLTGIIALFFACENLEIKREIKIETDSIIFNATTSSADLKGEILDLGETEIINHGHCWSTLENPSINLPTKTEHGVVSTRGVFISKLSALQPNTKYYSRAYATDAQGTVYGNEVSFTTSKVSIGWQKALGGNNWDYASFAQQTIDGGYIVIGSSSSVDGDVTGNHGEDDYWVVKLTSAGQLDWQKAFGGSSDDQARSIQQTADGGYIIAGSSYSNDGDVSGSNGSWDYWIVKLTSTGQLDWQKSYGGSSIEDEANCIQQTTDGGFIIAGASYSNDGDVSGNHGEKDYWIVKLTSSGQLSWQKSLGGSRWDFAHYIQQTADGGYIVSGYSNSNDGDVSGNHGNEDGWIVKLTSGGELSWQKSFGGSGHDEAISIRTTADGGYIVAGSSDSNDGDVSENHGVSDCWIIKLTSTGQIEWQKSLGGSLWDYALYCHQTTDGGYIISATSASNDGDVTGNHGFSDYWVVKLTSTGQMDWQKSLGGSGANDWASSIQQTTDGGYIVAGSSDSNDGDVTVNHGGHDYWIVKINTN